MNDPNIQLLWQTGKPFYEEAVTTVQNINNVIVHEFIYEMSKAYKAADIIISRAGAIAISELALLGKPIILIPYPHATGNHQYKNALSLKEQNAAIIIEDQEADKILINTILTLIMDSTKKNSLSQNIMAFAKPNALNQIVDEIINLSK